MLVSRDLDRVLTRNSHWKNDYTDRSGNKVPSVVGGHSVFSEEELFKLQEAERLISEVRDNYRENYFKMKSQIK